MLDYLVAVSVLILACILTHIPFWHVSIMLVFFSVGWWLIGDE